MTTSTRRLGVLTPSSNTVLEPEICRLASASTVVSAHFSRFSVTRVDNDDSSEQFAIRPMIKAASLLADAQVDALVWAGTSGSWLGLKRDRELVGALENELGVPATTATLGLVQLMHELRVRNYALVVPYVEPIKQRILDNLAEEGFACSGARCWGITDNFQFALISGEEIMRAARDLTRTGKPDAIVVHCTNMRGAEVADQLAAELGLPILDSVVVSWWAALSSLSAMAASASQVLYRLPGLPEDLEVKG
jgi:maleate isomerase